MRFLAAVSTTLALALGVSAIPQGQDGHGERDVKQATNQQAGGSKACCLNKSTIKSDGILNDALARGLLTDVLGASDQACAETELIGSLNLLGFVKKGSSDECAETSAHCQDEKCHAD